MASTPFEIQYTVDRNAPWPHPLTMWVVYADGSRNYPTFNSSPYAFPPFVSDLSDSRPIAPDADGVYRTGPVNLPRNVPDGSHFGTGSDGIIVLPNIKNYSGMSEGIPGYDMFDIVWARCTAGRLSEIYFYGCPDCTGGGG
jgi:hypothetical protein